MNDNDYLEHYGVLGMKWGIRKVNKQARKAARLQRRSVYNEEMSKASNAVGEKGKSKKYLKKAEKYNEKSTKLLAKANERVNKIASKKDSVRRASKRQKLNKYLQSEKSKANFFRTKYELDNATNKEMAFKEAAQRRSNKQAAIVSSIVSGTTLATTWLTGGFFAMPFVSIAATAAVKNGMSKAESMAGEDLYFDASGNLIKKKK